MRNEKNHLNTTYFIARSVLLLSPKDLVLEYESAPLNIDKKPWSHIQTRQVSR